MAKDTSIPEKKKGQIHAIQATDDLCSKPGKSARHQQSSPDVISGGF
jgi:hypothetical protein